MMSKCLALLAILAVAHLQLSLSFTLTHQSVFESRVQPLQMASQDDRFSEMQSALGRGVWRTSKLLGGLLVACSISGTPAMALEASQLFQKSQEAMQVADGSYKDVIVNWAATKRSLADTQAIFARTDKQLTKIVGELERVQDSIRTMTAKGDEGLAKIEQEVLEITASLSEKYLKAEEAAPTAIKPSTLAALFLKGENEATILKQETAAARHLSEANALNKVLLTRLTTATEQVRVLERQTADVLVQADSAQTDLLEGIDLNLAFCRDKLDGCVAKGNQGLAQFRVGYKQELVQQERFNQVVKNLDTALRSIQTVKGDFAKSLALMDAQIAEREAWEKSTHLQLKQGKSQVGAYNSQLAGVSKNLQDRYVSFTRSYGATVDELAKAAQKNKKQTPSALLRGTLERLEAAQRNGIAAEKLLTKARAQGGKEAARFIVDRPAKAPVKAISSKVPAPTVLSATPVASPTSLTAAPAPASPTPPTPPSALGTDKKEKFQVTFGKRFESDVNVMKSSP
ncbi:hypothetical protein B484DRAFT_428681 [Ochromonadaceae sp. CCMP2298]|nr:hypothetical protein B484DRAFT_428681 [Ochromonadaceae sp. CCMP2298]